MDNGYYASRERKLSREFDKTLNRIREVFVSRYGEDAGEMLREARQEYDALIRLFKPIRLFHFQLGEATG